MRFFQDWSDMAWLSGQSYNTSCCVLYVLKTRYLILRQTVKKSIPVIELWCDKCMYNLFTSTLIQVFPYSANISDMRYEGFRVIVESNITPKFRACDEGVTCKSPIVINGRETFDNCYSGFKQNILCKNMWNRKVQTCKSIKVSTVLNNNM